MLYEGYRAGFDNAFHVHYETRLTFPSHIHRSYELVVVLDGEMTATINSVQYPLHRGDALIIFPHQSHSYRSTAPNRVLVFIFSPGCVPSFHHMVAQSVPVHPVYSLNGAIMMRVCDDVHQDSYRAFEKEVLDPMMSKGVLYSLLAPCLQQCTMVHRSASTEGNLLEQILLLIDSTPLERLSLNSIASELGYEYTYISKFFKQGIGMSFTNYVNQYRIHCACQILRDQDCKMLDVSMRVGYNNLRSFNHNFKKIVGITPHQYLMGEEPRWEFPWEIVIPDREGR